MDGLLAQVTRAAAAEGAAAAAAGGEEELLVPARTDRSDGPADLTASLPTVEAASTLCQICCKHYFKYTCPKCQMRYCSLTCYKSEAHADCSEGFYKAEFMEGLKSKVANPTERQQMAATLRRFEAEQAAEAEGAAATAADDPKADLLDRIKGLDLDDESQTEQVLAALTEAERAQFADRAYLASLLVQWHPWWSEDVSTETSSWAAEAPAKRPLVEELGGAVAEVPRGAARVELDDSDGDSDPAVGGPAGAARRERAEPPPLPEAVQPLGELLRGKQPAKELIFNLLDLLYCYAYTCRRYNGDVDEPWAECAEGLLAISPVLCDGVAHSSVEVALLTTVAKVQDTEAMFVSAWASARVLGDVAAICADSDRVSRAVAHLHRIVARVSGSKAPIVMPNAREARQRLKRAERKLHFFVSWWTWLAAEEGDGHPVATRLLDAIRVETAAVRAKRDAELAAVQADKQAYEKAWNGPTPRRGGSMIEELP